jgi:hypothetical protein
MSPFSDYWGAVFSLYELIRGVVEVDIQPVHVRKAQQEWCGRFKHLEIDFSDLRRDLRGADGRCNTALTKFNRRFSCRRYVYRDS